MGFYLLLVKNGGHGEVHGNKLTNVKWMTRGAPGPGPSNNTQFYKLLDLVIASNNTSNRLVWWSWFMQGIKCSVLWRESQQPEHLADL